MVYYNITWHSSVVKLPHTFLSIGICEKTGNPSHYCLFNLDKPLNEESLKILLIHNVHVFKRECQDAAYCIDLECPFNNASLAFLKTKGIKTCEQLEKLHSFIQKLATDLKLKNKGAVVVEYQKPLATVKKRKL